MSIANRLAKFRIACEKEAGATAADIEVPLSHALDDVCRVLKVSDRQRRHVLGKQSVTRFETTISVPKLKKTKR
jgi:hypothetical protein